MDKTINWELALIIFVRSLSGKKPPEEISVKARFKELKDLIDKKFNIPDDAKSEISDGSDLDLDLESFEKSLLED